MLNIITSRHVYTTLQAEIDEAITNGKISSPVVSDAEARSLPYLQAVIKEGLRIHPPAVGLASKVVPPAGDTINGIFVPGGTKIGANFFALLHNADAFSPDPASFRPERWLEAGPEQLAKMEKVQELVWGYGKYVCLGRSVALIELNKIFVEVCFRMVNAAGIFGGLMMLLLTVWVQFLRNFDWTLIDPTHPWNSVCYAIFVMSDMWVRVMERKK
jgi:cytochrome P450